MANLVIVAIPREDDYVWKLSSEKVPHLTICFLGEATTNPNVSRIMLFLEHAVKLWERGPFGLSVDHREEAFGPDEADVLVFKKDWSFTQLETFRNQLLKNTDIRNAYDSVEQYPEWIPHMTMGYPETPAKEDTRDYPGIRWVEFDRIALWFGNYEGPEFRLEYDYDFGDVAMSTKEVGAEFISHFGVKGMKWGVRKSDQVHPDIADVPKKTRKEASADAEEFTRAKLFYGEGAGTRRKLIKAKVDTKKEKDPQYAKAFDHFVSQTDLAKRASQARSQRKRTDVKKSTKKTAKGVGNVLRGRSQYANTAAVLGVGAGSYLYRKHVQQGEAMDQTADLGEEFILEHFGVKGMRWGVRKSGITSTGPAREVTVKTTHGPTGKLKVKTKGGQLHEVADDAVKFHTTRQKMKRSGVDALSNKELQEVVQRMNLEQQINSLSAKRPKSLGEKAVEESLKDPVKTGQTVKKVASTAKDVAIVAPIAADIGRHYLKKR